MTTMVIIQAGMPLRPGMASATGIMVTGVSARITVSTAIVIRGKTIPGIPLPVTDTMTDITVNRMTSDILAILLTTEATGGNIPGGQPCTWRMYLTGTVSPVPVSPTRDVAVRCGPVLQAEGLNNRELEGFFASHEETAFYVAYAALWNRETALDVVQDSMLRLIEYYRDKSPADWPALFRTILNSKINDVRRKRLVEQGKLRLVSLTGLFQKDPDEQRAMQEFEPASPDRVDGITAPEIESVTAELRQRVSEALQALSQMQRQVFILREWRGMTIRETSQTLGCSENSVKQHHFRAMRELRKQLAEVWEYA
jgi:RNA polymerase sigma-70 factor (ECF subfamily)